MTCIVNERYELVSVDLIRPHPKNPRRGNLDVLVESIQKNGFYGALVVQRSTGFIVAGNHRYLAAKKCGINALPVLWVDVDDQTARRILLADNRTSDLATYDDEQLAALLREACTENDLLGTGYTDDDLEALIERARAGERVLQTECGDADEIEPDLPQHADSKPGEVYELGSHRLLCGDATSITDLEKLLSGEKADLLWTDPPYNVDYHEKTSRSRHASAHRPKALKIANDAMSDERFREFLTEAFSTASISMRDGACFYIAHADAQTVNFRLAARTVGWHLSQNLIWVKDSFTLGRGDYHWRHEPILYGWKEGAPHRPLADRTQDTVWEFARPRRSLEHPTMKPVALVERAIRNSTKAGDLVLDCFGGSGTTLIAAARTGRRARLAELDPRYCDVIRRRWQKHVDALGAADASEPTAAAAPAA